MNKGSFFAGPQGPTHVRTSFRKVRGLAASGIALCAVFFFLYAFRVYTTADPDTESFRQSLYPQAPLHSGLSNPPAGFYKDHPVIPFGASDRKEDSKHHQLSDDGALSESDAAHNPNFIPGHAGAQKDKPEDKSADKPAEPEKESDRKPFTDDFKPTTDDFQPKPSEAEPVKITEDTTHSGSTGKTPTNPNGLTTTIVVGRTDSGVNGTQWIYDQLKDITEAAIYIVDDPEAPLHLNKNKGRESMVYMKYIMQHYDKLSDVTIFFHSGRTAWHNNALSNKDGAVMINNLRRQHVVDVGYFNMRCELHPGCPQWIKFNASREENKARHPERFNDLFSVAIWDQLFPDRTHDPVWLAQPCCSQYALSREMIRSRPLSDYVRIHDFLADSRIGDGYLGRIFEYVWQFLWLGVDEHCPSMSDCYCKGYGTCLTPEDQVAITEWNDARSKEDELLTDLGAYDAEHCNPMDDVDERRECKKQNPFLPNLSETRRKIGSVMEANLKKYIIKEP